MMKKLFYISLCILCNVALDAQSPVASYSFDCNLNDGTGTFSDMLVDIVPNCECGIVDDCYNLVTNSNFRTDTVLSNIVEKDFAISFYFQPTNNSNSVELISLGNNCSNDSLMRVYYLGDMNEVVFEMSESVLESVTLRGIVPSNKCWNHVIISRERNDFYLYLNGELVDNRNDISDIRVNSKIPIRVGNGPCVGILSNVFNGLIDELKFFNEHVQLFRARSLYIPYDEILQRDTVIFIGDFLDVEATENCTNNITWFPSTGLSNTNTFNTTIEGISTIDYVARFDGEFCISTDTLKVFVIDPADIKCEELVLPNVFTPNGDKLNDDFGILNTFIIEKMEYFEIYDRWGEKVFYTTNKQERWDGSFKEKELNSGMFLYKIAYTCENKAYVNSGNVSILR